MSGTLALVDADQYFYVATSLFEDEGVFDSTVHPQAWMIEADTYLVSDVAAARRWLSEVLLQIAEAYDNTILCFTSTPNFRHDCLSSYKGGRLKKRKPIGYWKLVEEFVKSPEWETRKIPGLEADDVMSILATHPKYKRLHPGGITILSNDKDMRQVPDTPIITKDGMSTIVGLAEANNWRYTQALAGDTTDGYSGLPGWGKVKAGKYLDEYWGMDEEVYITAVISAYMDAGLTATDACAQMNCARILRYGEYDFKLYKPKLLCP